MNRSDIGRYDPFKVSYNLSSCNPPTIARKTCLSHLFMALVDMQHIGHSSL